MVIVSRGADNLASAQATLATDGIDITPIAADLSDGVAAEQSRDCGRSAGRTDCRAGQLRRRRYPRVPPSELTPDKWRVAMDAKFFTYMNVMDYVRATHGPRGATQARSSTLSGQGEKSLRRSTSRVALQTRH